MPVTIRVTGKGLDEIPLTSEELLREIGLLVERTIRTRVEQGVDGSGAPFRPLSPAYAKQKAQAGLPPIPNLTVSGRMLNDMAMVELTASSVSIGFLSAGGTVPRVGRQGRKKGVIRTTLIQRSRAIGAADKAFFHTEVGAGRSQVKREFFGIWPKDEEQIETALDRYLDRVMP